MRSISSRAPTLQPSNFFRAPTAAPASSRLDLEYRQAEGETDRTPSETENVVMAAEFSDVQTAAIQQMISAAVAAVSGSQQRPVDPHTAPAVPTALGELGLKCDRDAYGEA